MDIEGFITFHGLKRLNLKALDKCEGCSVLSDC